MVQGEREQIAPQAAVPRVAGPTRFPCLDGMRAIAALSVFAFHFLGRGDPSWMHGTTRIWVSRLGLQGVGIFFVISGFLLYRPFVAAAFRGTQHLSVGSFWRRRFVRILPAYWIALTAYFYIFKMFAIHGFANVVTYYGLLQNYRAGYAMYGLGVAWTLGIELGFYLILPGIDWIARRAAGRAPDRDRILRTQLMVAAALATVGLTVKVLSLWVLTGFTAKTGSWFPIRALGWSVLGYLDWFAVGIALAIASVWFAQEKPMGRVAAGLVGLPGACWLVALILFAAETHVGAGAGNQFVLSALVVLTAAMLLLPAVFGPQDRGAIRSVLRGRAMSFLGRISYGIYLWHFIFVVLSLRWIASGALPDVFILRLATVGGLTLATAIASFYLVERPLMTWSHRRHAPVRAG
jgi:peptidoglycan/LPS O-acetylase OafA/YrhL